MLKDVLTANVCNNVIRVLGNKELLCYAFYFLS
jgi:hypothetical protein